MRDQWYVDANILIYYFDQHPQFFDGVHTRLREAVEQQYELVLTPTVVTEVTYVLLAPPFRCSRSRITHLLTAFVQTDEVICEDEEAVLLGLSYFGEEMFDDFVDGYLAARVQGADGSLFTHDSALADSDAVPTISLPPTP